MSSRLRSVLVCFNAALALSVIAAYSHSPTGYHPSFYTMVPLLSWGALAVAIVTGLWLIMRSNVGGLYAATLLTVVLLLFPTIVTGEPFGTDTFNKAGDVLGVLSGLDTLPEFYPGMISHAAVIAELTEIDPVTVGPQLAIAILAPVSMVVFARNLSLDRAAVRLVLATSILLPLGFGVYLSTISTFHNYYLSLPIAVAFVSTVSIGWIGHKTYIRYVAVALPLGFVTLLYHPLSFFAAALLASVIQLGSDIQSTTLSDVIKSTVRSGTRLAVLFVPFFVYFFWFAIVSSEAWIIPGILAILGFSLSGGGSSPTCVPSPIVNHCGIEWAGNMAVALLFFGTSMAVVGTIGVEMLRLRRCAVFNDSRRSLFILLSAYSISVVGLFASGIVGRNVLIRLLPFGTLAAISVIALGMTHFRVQSLSLGSGVIFLAGLLVVGIVTLSLFIINVQMGAVAVLVLFPAVVVGGAIYRFPDRRTQIGQVVIVVLLILSLPVLYPAPETNARANPAPAPGTDAQMAWITTHVPTDAQYAAGKEDWRHLRYADRGIDPSPLQGSAWIFTDIGLSENKTLVSVGRNFVTTETTVGPDYIFFRPYYRYHPTAVYEEDGMLYRALVTTSVEDIENTYPRSNKIYTTGEGSVRTGT